MCKCICHGKIKFGKYSPFSNGQRKLPDEFVELKNISVQLWRKSILSQLRYILYLRATLPNPKKHINRSNISQSNKITSAGLSGHSKLWKFEQTPATFHYTPFLYSQMKRITSFSLQFYLFPPPLRSDILIYAARLQPNTICHSPRCLTSVASELGVPVILGGKSVKTKLSAYSSCSLLTSDKSFQISRVITVKCPFQKRLLILLVRDLLCQAFKYRATAARVSSRKWC